MRWSMGQGDPYALLASLLETERLPHICRDEGGKPYFPHLPQCRFSVSRSGELALCAVGGVDIGADIEKLRPRNPKFPRYALSERELAWFSDRGSRWEDFYALWTLKEARVKCTGEGIFRRPARTVSVPLLSTGERALWDGFLFTALGGEDWRGAVCERQI